MTVCGAIALVLLLSVRVPAASPPDEADSDDNLLAEPA